MSVWFWSRLNPWYISIPSNPNLYSTKIIMKMGWQTIASSVSIRTISPTATPLPKACGCVAVCIAGRRTNLVVYGWRPKPPTKNIFLGPGDRVQGYWRSPLKSNIISSVNVCICDCDLYYWDFFLMHARPGQNNGYIDIQPGLLRKSRWQTLPNRRISQIRTPLATCRETVGSYNRLSYAQYVFKHKIKYLLIHAPYTRAVVFDISVICPHRFRRVKIVIILPCFV